MNCQAEQRSGGPADALRAVGGPTNGTKNLLYYIYENAIINGRFETACVQAMFLFLLILISVIECSDIAKLPGSDQSSTAFQLSAEFQNCMSGFHCNTNRDCLSGSLRIRIFRIPSEKAAVQSGTDDDHDPGRVITNYTTIQSLHLTNTYAGLVVTSLISGTSIFLMRQFFMTIPKDYKEAAVLDGCGEMRFLFHIILPMSKPTISSMAVYLFVQIYNQFFWPLLVTNTEKMRTIQIGISMLVTGDVVNYGHILAGAVIAIIPAMMIYIIGQDYMIRGMTSGGVKG